MVFFLVVKFRASIHTRLELLSFKFILRSAAILPGVVSVLPNCQLFTNRTRINSLYQKMSLVCHSCAGDVTGEHITCQGFCNATFHPRCCGVSADSFEEVMRNPQVFWLCKSCSTLMRDVRFRGTTRSAHELGQEAVLHSQSNILNNLKSEILSELKTVIQSNFTAMINSNAFTPKTSRRFDIEPRLTRGRRLFSTNNPAPTERKPTLLRGSGSTLSPSDHIATVPVSAPKFWLYISRIAPDVSVEQITALTKRRLGTDDVKVIRLVAKGRDTKEMSFISFKIGIPNELKEKALSTSTWPKGIVFREFRYENVNVTAWRPHTIIECSDPLNISSETHMI